MTKTTTTTTKGKATTRPTTTTTTKTSNKIDTKTNATTVSAKSVPVATNRTTATAKTKKTITTEERYNMIANLAYLFAEQRGFTNGSQEGDWLRAEKEIDNQFKTN
ncbi:MAG: hypothetical protein A2504_03810 [Bdellovibrionales bacterium RIFOXYD12_FULL_39_22]|nr:MAG: hypothetical protein A2385_11560 [Bdellovibrionales bacterium RIFOXYB1_FULL_39_21]OFZ41702.1 MAG: hypothetical protein A2485_01870 [Bdellovibrionales bacterium RIFOXYC12_FULL_39_17]OFZ46102.1 MAG: hypothetical protein A2404_12235 [Bdellovibrionales bacterium RIFOXYC1_FULL_39_130]OFZ53533.1 MAG: hypothetical protein A2328_02720 [Bdellovibrionales bacterium RIFOXYB2_FULL_36_6]OFZ74929.1 MAG: hypothetical protein A2560_15275 [Bdellovibrionales bacterium RIFOXYD1_FULL_39_84]OFZ92782.1 MAG: